MVAINRKGYLVRQRLMNKITDYSRDWWIVKPYGDKQAHIQIGKAIVKVDPSLIGKQFRIKIEPK